MRILIILSLIASFVSGTGPSGRRGTVPPGIQKQAPPGPNDDPVDPPPPVCFDETKGHPVPC